MGNLLLCLVRPACTSQAGTMDKRSGKSYRHLQEAKGERLLGGPWQCLERLLGGPWQCLERLPGGPWQCLERPHCFFAVLRMEPRTSHPTTPLEASYST